MDFILFLIQKIHPRKDGQEREKVLIFAFSDID
jgi:hypothetical protein